MKIKNIEQNEEGQIHYDVEATPEETSFLLSHAINDLIAQGYISLAESSGDQEVALREVTH